MESWTPAVSLDLLNATTAKFKEVEKAFVEWCRTTTAPLMPVPENGWHHLTPQHCEGYLRRNIKNREIVLRDLQSYGVQMVNNQWKKTGESVIFTDQGNLADGQKRLWAAYLTNTAFDTYVVSDVPDEPYLFAYIDAGSSRTPADALWTAGINGMSKNIAQTIKQLAIRFEQGKLTTRGTILGDPITNPEILGFMQNNPGLNQGAHLIHGSYASAAKRLDSPIVATFVAWQVLENYGEETLDRFLSKLMERDLSRNDPVGALQVVLEKHRKAKDAAKSAAERRNHLSTNLLLAYVIKGFNAWLLNQTVRSLGVESTEAFPLFAEAPAEREAA
jgi:hypothetical protein